ncbi:MAG: hypothetical protein ACLFQB_02225 [Chitinispirillaceae bacterium]
MVRVSCFVYLLLLLQFSTSGDSLEVRYAGEILHIPVGADVAAMGDVGVVLPRRAVSVHWNPASAGMLRRYEASLEYAGLYWGLSHHGAAAFHTPLQDETGITGLVMPFYSGAITTYDTLPGTLHERLLDPSKRADGSGTGVLTDNQTLFLLALGKMFSFPIPRSTFAGQPRTVDVAFGGAFRGITHTIKYKEKVRMGMNANIDAGIVARVGLDYDFNTKETVRFLTLGATFKNFIPGKVTWAHSVDESGIGEYSEPLKAIQYYGIAYEDRSQLFGGDWVFALSIHNDYEVSYHGGVEAVFWDIAAFRAGFSDGVPTLGAGITYQNYFFDYAFRFDPVDISPLRVVAGVVF